MEVDGEAIPSDATSAGDDEAAVAEDAETDAEDDDEEEEDDDDDDNAEERDRTTTMADKDADASTLGSFTGQPNARNVVGWTHAV